MQKLNIVRINLKPFHYTPIIPHPQQKEKKKRKFESNFKIKIHRTYNF